MATPSRALRSETGFGPLIGRSPEMRRVCAVLERIAPSEATVLITGESGTGKEVAARALHHASPRRNRPFVVVDCGALPPSLVESELFGHERGAFTGAHRARAGAFEAGCGGTVFLDEIGEMPLEMQSRLLGVLERRRVTRIGTNEPQPIDVRLVAATNRDLRREIDRGHFREDLYFRLAVVHLELPPLRVRPGDIPLYIEMFLAGANPGRVPAPLDAAAIDKLKAHSWPGNVRELRNVLERAVALGTLEMEPTASGVSCVPSPQETARANAADTSVPFKVGKANLVEEYERAYIQALMHSHENNITRAARAAEIDRVYLLRLLDKYGMRPGR